MPEEIVATSDHNKYDVMQGARQNFIENRVAPWCGRLEAEEDMTVKSFDARAVGWNAHVQFPIPVTHHELRLSLESELADRRGLPR